MGYEDSFMPHIHIQEEKLLLKIMKNYASCFGKWKVPMSM